MTMVKIFRYSIYLHPADVRETDKPSPSSKQISEKLLKDTC